MNILTVRNAQKSFCQENEVTEILKNFNMSVKQKSIYCLLGSSGVGKTTIISAILGIVELDAGEITVFGQKIESQVKSKYSHKIGYMPQHLSLNVHLTVKQILKYYANIYEVKPLVFKERFKLLKNILELPSDDSVIGRCSTGQQRRVSLAVALIHDPPLMILDEPTVGLDPILRENVWSFLTKCVNNYGKTVILTTHYLIEARFSSKIGFIRDGSMLIEDSPENMQKNLNISDLDHGLMLLCSGEKYEGEQEVEDVEQGLEFFNNSDETVSMISRQRVGALMSDEFIFIKTRITFFIVNFVGIVFALIALLNIVGRYPEVMNIGIVNDDSNCQMLPLTDNKCLEENLSCYLIQELCDPLNLIYYNSTSEALKNARWDQLYLIYHFKRNFSENIISIFNSEYRGLTDFDIHLTSDNPMFIQHVCSKFEDSFNFMLSTIAKSCNISEKLSKIQVIESIDIQEGSFLNDGLPAGIMMIIFLPAFVNSCYSILISRREGTWNRTLLSKVSLVEIVISHLIVYLIMNLLQSVTILITCNAISDLENRGNFFLELLLIYLTSLIGMFVGLLTSCICSDVKTPMKLSFCMSLLLMFGSNFWWPYEGMHPVAKVFSNLLPITHPAKGLKDIIMKGFTIHPSIIVGFSTSLIWITVLAILITVALKKQKYFVFK